MSFCSALSISWTRVLQWREGAPTAEAISDMCTVNVAARALRSRAAFLSDKNTREQFLKITRATCILSRNYKATRARGLKA